ncbi:MAG TPA: aromatic ring-hydroxylating dioxygenase subunit alpha [Hyphomonadaceae bacterium]|nr:aromatic ring-hydroxylating dioxygenase subunit alpha [Hyphomonadaceae bacterium]
MFDGFAHVWTPLVEAQRVKSNPVQVGIAGERLVLFRGAEGTIAALLDRCPHRRAALSLGTVGRDGCLECPFHGWRFDAAGANRHVPLNPDAKRDLLGATPVPAKQVGDMVWIYTAPGIHAPYEPVAPDGLTAPGLARIYLERTWRCHWTRAMENMLDSPHLPFVHRRTIGRILRRRMKPKSRMDISWEETTWGGRAKAALDGVDGGGSLEFFRPNMMALNIPIPRRHLQIHALVTPIDANLTRLTLAVSRDFLRSPIMDALFARSSRRIADEDQAVVESSQPREAPPPGHEQSVRTDRATLAFRKYYYETLRPSRAGQ